MTLFAVQVEVHFVVDVSTPYEALAWLNGEHDLPAKSYGHVQWVAPLLEEDLPALRKRDEAGYEAASGGWPVLARWSPATWPARTCLFRGPMLERRNRHAVPLLRPVTPTTARSRASGDDSEEGLPKVDIRDARDEPPTPLAPDNAVSRP